jgi:hypothetical protein
MCVPYLVPHIRPPTEPGEAKYLFSIVSSSIAISLHGHLCSLCHRCVTGKPLRRAVVPPLGKSSTRAYFINMSNAVLKTLCTTSRGQSTPLLSAYTGASPTAGHLRSPLTVVSAPQDPPQLHIAP